MKFRGLLVAVGALVLLGGLVYWSNEVEKAKEGEPDPDASPKIIDIEEDTIASLEIRGEGKEPVILKKSEDGGWSLTAPEELKADETSVGSLVTAVASLDSNRLVEETATDLATYGLDSPVLEVVAGQTDGKSIKLLVGDETPTGGNFFAKVADDPRVFTLASWNKTSLEKTAWDLRDKQLVPFDSDKLSRVELTAGGETVEMGKNAQNEWQIVKPRPLRADGGNVEQLVSRLRDAKMDSEAEASNASAFKSAKRVAVARVTDASGTVELEVRKTSSGDYYAKSSAVDGVYKITTTLGEGLDKRLDDLRNKKLFDFGWSELSKISFRDGDTTAVYERTEDKWMKDGTQMDSVTVRALIDELRDLTASAFPDKGFTEPIVEAEVTWGEDNRTEKVLISKNGGRYFAKRDGEPTIYELDDVVVEDLQEIAGEVKEHTEEEETDKEEPSDS